MKLLTTTLDSVKLIDPTIFKDDRGFFMETYHHSKFKDLGITDTFVQDNHSYSQQGTLRGLHYQTAPYAQAKLVRVTQGEIFDVACDIRSDSPTYGQWFGTLLNDTNHHMLYIPGDFAHGFYVLSKTAHLVYKCSSIYSPDHDRSIHWQDPTLAIDWPLIKDLPVSLSHKDKNAPLL